MVLKFLELNKFAWEYPKDYPFLHQGDFQHPQFVPFLSLLWSCLLTSSVKSTAPRLPTWSAYPSWFTKHRAFFWSLFQTTGIVIFHHSFRKETLWSGILEGVGHLSLLIRNFQERGISGAISFGISGIKKRELKSNQHEFCLKKNHFCRKEKFQISGIKSFRS